MYILTNAEVIPLVIATVSCKYIYKYIKIGKKNMIGPYIETFISTVCMLDPYHCALPGKSTCNIRKCLFISAQLHILLNKYMSVNKHFLIWCLIDQWLGWKSLSTNMDLKMDISWICRPFCEYNSCLSLKCTQFPTKIRTYKVKKKHPYSSFMPQSH